MKKVIIAAGYGQSGNSCVRDFFREFKNFYVMMPEFDLIKYANGLNSLAVTLIYNNNLFTADYAIKRYLNLVKFYNRTFYKELFPNNKLVKITEKFLDKLIVLKYKTNENVFNWHENDENIQLRAYIHKLSQDNNLFNKIFRNNKNEFKLNSDFTYIVKYFTKEKFNSLVKEYIENILTALTDKPNICLVNALQSAQLPLGLDYFYDAKVITCIRDPRDVYVDFKNKYSEGLFIPVKSFKEIDSFFEEIFYIYPPRFPIIGFIIYVLRTLYMNMKKFQKK